jgi:hypothetical protein
MLYVEALYSQTSCSEQNLVSTVPKPHQQVPNKNKILKLFYHRRVFQSIIIVKALLRQHSKMTDYDTCCYLFICLLAIKSKNHSRATISSSVYMMKIKYINA